MIQAVMLIALGFLMATLIGVLLAPALWSRARRLTRKRLEQSLPTTLAEIEATQDQIRASYAVRVRRLEKALAGAKQRAAMQLVDNSRLQMQIAALRDEVSELELKLAERRNASTVLEQTITRRFPELDREIASVKAQLQESSYHTQDLANRLSRREEELAAAEREAAAAREELALLRDAMEKRGADRSGRRLKKASQWGLEDYRAEYDRLNLELSRLRQQVAQLQERESQQAGLIKGELTKLAELILISSHPKVEPRPPEEPRQAERSEPPAKRLTAAPRRDRPRPWPHAAAGTTMPPTGAGPAPEPLPVLVWTPLLKQVQRAAEAARTEVPPAPPIETKRQEVSGEPGQASTTQRPRILQEVTGQPAPPVSPALPRPAHPSSAASSGNAGSEDALRPSNGKPYPEMDELLPGRLEAAKEIVSPAPAEKNGDAQSQGRTLIDRLRSVSEEAPAE